MPFISAFDPMTLKSILRVSNYWGKANRNQYPVAFANALVDMYEWVPCPCNSLDVSDVIANGSEREGFSGNISISSSGIITPVGVETPVFHAVMSSDKKMFIATTNDTHAGYNMMIFQR